MQIRRMQPEDYDAVTELWHAAGLPFSPEGRESREAIARQIGAFPALSLVAEEDGGIAGAVLGTHDCRKGWINRLAVSPEFRRRGVAAALAARLEEEFNALGIEIFAAMVKSDNAASTALCKSLGCEPMDNILYFSKRSRPDV